MCVFLYVYHTPIKNIITNAAGWVDCVEVMATFPWEGQPTAQESTLCAPHGRYPADWSPNFNERWTRFGVRGSSFASVAQCYCYHIKDQLLAKIESI